MGPRKSRAGFASFGDLPIFWKLLLPFIALLLAVGSAGAYVVVHDLSTRSASALSQQLVLRSVEARSLMHDAELDLLESANYAANLSGVAAATATKEQATLLRLLRSVLALKSKVHVAAVLDAGARTLVEVDRGTDGRAVAAVNPAPWPTTSLIRRALSEGASSDLIGFVALPAGGDIGIVAPVCGDPGSGPSNCRPVGYAVLTLSALDVVRQIATSARDGERGAEDVALYELSGPLVASTVTGLPGMLSSGATPSRIVQRLGGARPAAYAGFTLGGRPAGVVEVRLQRGAASASVRGAAARLVVVLVIAMGAAFAVGALISRLILRQLRSLVHASRELGSGRLATRAPVLANDEHGELARALNSMAEQIEVDHLTLEMQVEQRTEEIRRLLRDRSDFFAGLSHELRTPLAVILTQAKMLLSRASEPELSREAGQAIAASARQLLDVVNDILTLARAEAGGVEVDPRPMPLRSLLNELRPLLAGMGRGVGVKVVVHASHQVPPVWADPLRVRDVLVNLVANAVKYTPSGGRVDVSAEVAAEHVRVSVADTGVGIPLEVGDRVFEPFYMVPGNVPQTEAASTGLGLALSRRWLDALGGSIEWRPNPGGGTVFSFTLPLATVSA
ncbi:MAG: two-component system, OmpR family, sensor histidine kinase BaeS [Frankiales bacterium]|nr:two-component system, OmpR family, sensor histidine kinase BaeS [Frankiales bacterium]